MGIDVVRTMVLWLLGALAVAGGAPTTVGVPVTTAVPAYVSVPATVSAPAPGDDSIERAARGKLAGTVLDAASEKPLPGAEVALLVAGHRRITNLEGRFTFGDVDVRGPDTLVIRHLTYDSLRLPIESADLPDADLEFLLSPRPIEIAGVDVAVDAHVRSEARRLADISQGFFWDRSEFETHAITAQHIADPLRWSGKVSYVTEYSDGSRCITIRLGKGCAQVLINNVFVNPSTLSHYAAEDIQSYVVIDPINATTLYGTGADGGVIVVYLRGR